MPYAEYLALGETHHHEYYDGMVHVNPPSYRHVQVARRLTRVLEDACPPGYEVTPEWGWRVAEQQDFEPDVMVVPRQPPGSDLLRTAPLLVVEITSPSTRSEDWVRKREAYAKGGAPWYWIVDPSSDELVILRNDGGVFESFARFATGGPHEVQEPFPVKLDLGALFA